MIIAFYIFLFVMCCNIAMATRYGYVKGYINFKEYYLGTRIPPFGFLAILLTYLLF